METTEGKMQSKAERAAHYMGVHMQSVAETAPDSRLPQLVALFAKCDERGRHTILALAGVQAKLTAERL